MKKKLLMTASTFPRWEGDSEPRFILDLAKSLNQYFDVTVLAPAAVGARDREILEGVKVLRYHYFPIHKFETLCYPGAIAPRIKEKKIRILLVPFLFFGLYIRLFCMLPKYDYVHAHWLIPQGIVQSFFRKKYIVTGHGSDVRAFNKGIVKVLKCRCLKNAQYITTVSEHLKDEVNILYPNAKTSVISMGCNIEMFGQERRIENLFGQGNRKVILFVGRLVEIKGVQYLIRAMERVDALLVVVGDGPLRENLEEEARQYGERIIFMGAKSHQQLAEIYASADIFVAPSITSDNGGQEGFGLTILEAMASGLPVVASRTGGIVDLIEDGKDGILVEERNVSALSEAINKLLCSDSVYSEIVKNAVIKARQYDYKVIANKYKQLFEKL